MPKKLLTRLAIAVASPILFVALLDLAVVMWGFEYPPIDSPITVPLPEGRHDGVLIHERSVRQLWRPAPGARIPWGKDERVNAAGWRGPVVPLAKTPGVLRIATLGDSSTFGHSVAYDETFSARLAPMLAEHGVQAEVIDAGVIGYTIRQGIERYKELVSPYEPDVVIAAFGAVNEHVPAMLYPDGELITRQVLNESWWVLEAHRLRRDLKALHFLAWCLDGFRGGRVQLRAQRSQHEMLNSHLAPTVGAAEWTGTRRVSVEEFGQCCVELRDLAKKDGARFLLLSLPRRPSVERTMPIVKSYTEKIFKVAVAEHIDVVDGRWAMAQGLKDGHTIPDLLLDLYHPSPLGHELLATALCEAILAPPGASSAQAQAAKWNEESEDGGKK